MSNIYLQLFRDLCKAKTTYVLLVFLGAFSYKSMNLMNNSSGGSILYIGYNQVLNEITLVLVLIPIFLVMNSLITKIMDRYTVLLKYDSIQSWWNRKMRLLIMILFLMVAVIYISIFLSFYLSENENLMDTTFFLFIIYGAVIQFFGFGIVALTYHIIMLLFEKEFIGIIVPMVLLMISERIKFIFDIHVNAFNTLGESMALSHLQISLNTGILWSDLNQLFLLIVVSGILYYIGLIIAEKKEFYWRK